MQEIRTEHLTVGYDKTPLIGDVNLSVRPGEILTLIGPNGSGKSTILKSIIRELSPLGGSVFLDGTALEDLKDDYKAVKETGWNRIFGRSIHG